MRLFRTRQARRRARHRVLVVFSVLTLAAAAIYSMTAVLALLVAR